MARFIDYGGNFQLRQPCHARRVDIHFFGVRGDEDRLQALCDRTLNLKDEHGDPVHPVLEYRAITSTVFLLFMKMDSIASQHPVDAQKGLLRETELNVAIPVLAWRKLAPLVWVPSGLLWFMPYLWIDTGVPMICGRETFGFPKMLADLALPSAFGQKAEYSVETDVWQPFGPGQLPRRGRPVEIVRTDAAPLESELHLPDVGAWVEKVLGWIGLPEVAAGLGDLAMLVKRTRFVFLKQFRDHAYGDDACYQAIIECPVEYPDFYGGDVLAGDFEARIRSAASCPIIQELGLAGATAGGLLAVQKPLFAARVNCDFVLGNGTTIWQA